MILDLYHLSLCQRDESGFTGSSRASHRRAVLSAIGAMLIFSSCASVSTVGGPVTNAPDSGSSPVASSSVSAVKGVAAVVAVDSNGDTVRFLTADGSTLGSAKVPSDFTPVRAIHPTHFLFGMPNADHFTVVDADKMTVHTYSIPVGINQVVEVDGKHALLLGTAISTSPSGDVVLVDLATGAQTSMRTIVGRPDAKWTRLTEFPDVIAFGDLYTFRSLVVPRSDPLAAWEVGSVVTSQQGSVLIGVTPNPAGAGVNVAAYNGNKTINLGKTFANLKPAGALLISNQTAFVSSTSGALSTVDLNSGTVRSVGNLGFTPAYLRSLGDNLGYTADALDGSGHGAVFRLQPYQLTSFSRDGVFFNYGSGAKCALIAHSAQAPAESASYVVDLTNGTVFAELGPEPIPLALDGCSATDTLNKNLVINGKKVDLAQRWFFDASADLHYALMRDTANVTRIVNLSTDTGVALPKATDYYFVDP